jgi:hypothetical protein
MAQYHENPEELVNGEYNIDQNMVGSSHRLEELLAIVKSGVVHFIIHKGKERLGSGTGFFVGGKLIANRELISGLSHQTHLAVRFQDTPPAHADFSFSAEEVERATVIADNEYAILDLPDLLDHNPHQFKLADHEPRIGQFVTFLGYTLQHWHLGCHASFLSSIYPSGESTILEFDTGINPGHVGAPLFDVNGEVLGIVMRRDTAFTDAVERLLDSLDDVISVLSKATFFATTSQAMVSIQAEMQKVARQLQRSSNVGSGFAIACDLSKHENILKFGS